MNPPSVKPRVAQGPTAAPGRMWAEEHSPQPSALLNCSPVLLLTGKGRPQRTKAEEDRRRAGRAFLGSTVQWLCSTGLTRNIFFFLVRETHPPWQFADSLETPKDHGLRGARRREGKERESRKKSPQPKPRHQSPSAKARGPGAGGRTPNHGGPLSPAHGAGGWGCGALLHPLGWLGDPPPTPHHHHCGRPSSLLPRT